MDMLGDSDSIQFSRELIHRFSKAATRDEYRGELGVVQRTSRGPFADRDGAANMEFDPVAGLCAESSRRDSERRRHDRRQRRGQRQTMILAAIDARLSLSFCDDVSTAMQGGALAENASLLKGEQRKRRFAALFAPKPQAVTGRRRLDQGLANRAFRTATTLCLVGAQDNVMRTRRTFRITTTRSRDRGSIVAQSPLQTRVSEPVIEDDMSPLA